MLANPGLWSTAQCLDIVCLHHRPWRYQARSHQWGISRAPNLEAAVDEGHRSSAIEEGFRRL